MAPPKTGQALRTIERALASCTQGQSYFFIDRRCVPRQRRRRAKRDSFVKFRTAEQQSACFRALSHNLEDRRHQLKRHENACRALGLDIEKLKSEQSAIDEDGRAGKVLAAGEDAAIAEKEVARLEAEVKALSLLASALSSAGQSARSQYLEPVARGFAPYLARVFPEAGLEFKDTFTLDAIVRAGQREDFATLSDGTREQLAVLVRMGFARLLADRGRAAPLILDDPLVYSDDARLAAMLRALEDAASIHQAVVLTCRETAFATKTSWMLWLSRDGCG